MLSESQEDFSLFPSPGAHRGVMQKRLYESSRSHRVQTLANAGLHVSTIVMLTLNFSLCFPIYICFVFLHDEEASLS